MAWLDDNGIAHDGEPPHGHQMLGGRWYAVDSDEARETAHQPHGVLIGA